MYSQMHIVQHLFFKVNIHCYHIVCATLKLRLLQTE